MSEDGKAQGLLVDGWLQYILLLYDGQSKTEGLQVLHGRKAGAVTSLL